MNHNKDIDKHYFDLIEQANISDKKLIFLK